MDKKDQCKMTVKIIMVLKNLSFEQTTVKMRQ